MSTDDPVYGVFAATGQQGGAVAQALLERGRTVRAVVRNPDSRQALALARRGVEVVQADVNDPKSLKVALTGLDAFWFMTTMSGGGDGIDEIAMGKTLIDAASEADVAHVVFNSVAGAERDSGVPHFETKWQVEEYLRGCDLSATVIRPVFFMENFAFMGPRREAQGVVVQLPLPDGIPHQMISTRDIGRLSSKALVDPASMPAAIEIAGDELTGSQIAHAFGERLKMPARYEALPLSVLGGQDDMQAMFRWFAETPSFQADLEQVRTLDPGVWTLPNYLAATRYTLPSN